jgi:uncharacterized membrane protein YtjA (UPF0391 family)
MVGRSRLLLRVTDSVRVSGGATARIVIGSRGFVLRPALCFLMGSGAASTEYAPFLDACFATRFVSVYLTRGATMLHWAAVFFVIAIIAAIFGFGGIAASATGIAKLLFVGFLIMAVVSLLLGRRAA